MIYAKIDMTNPDSGVGTVVEIQEMGPDDAQDPAFTWVDTDNVTCSDGTPVVIGCTYNGTVFTSLIPAVTLQQAQLTAITNFYSEVEVVILANFPQNVKLPLLILYVVSVNAGTFPNRVTYLTKAIVWLESLLGYIQTIIVAIESAGTVAAVQAITWNITGSILPAPGVTLLGAVSITN